MFEQSRQGAVDVIRGNDPLNVDHVEFLANLFEGCMEVGQPQVVFDMQAIPLIDSAGMELLLDIQEACRKRGGVMKLAAVNPLCLQILNATGVRKRFEVFADTSAAVGSFVR